MNINKHITLLIFLPFRIVDVIVIYYIHQVLQYTLYKGNTNLNLKHFQFPVRIQFVAESNELFMFCANSGFSIYLHGVCVTPNERVDLKVIRDLYHTLLRTIYPDVRQFNFFVMYIAHRDDVRKSCLRIQKRPTVL